MTDPGRWHDEPYRDPPGLKLGERAFEIALARQMAAGELQTAWFERHGSTPITEIPAHWPEAYRALVQRRLDAIRDNPNIALIERPEYKRRWLREPWDDQVQRALRGWLLDRLETERYWPDPDALPPELTTCASLAERAAHDADFLQVAALYAGRPDFAAAEAGRGAGRGRVGAVPARAALQAHGPAKRQVWERTWDLQRREDAGEDVGPIPVPPKYTSADFLTSDIWRLRGKLDVPKERFVSYPHCERDGDPSLVVGWAGWDHLQQAHGPGRLLRPDEDPRGLARRAPRAPAGRARSARALAQAVAQRRRPRVRPADGRLLPDFVRDEAQAPGVHPGAGQVVGAPGEGQGHAGEEEVIERGDPDQRAARPPRAGPPRRLRPQPVRGRHRRPRRGDPARLRRHRPARRRLRQRPGVHPSRPSRRATARPPTCTAASAPARATSWPCCTCSCSTTPAPGATRAWRGSASSTTGSRARSSCSCRTT